MVASLIGMHLDCEDFGRRSPAPDGRGNNHEFGPREEGSFASSARESRASNQSWSQDAQLRADFEQQRTELERLAQELQQAHKEAQALESSKAENARLRAELEQANQLRDNLGSAEERIQQQILELRKASQNQEKLQQERDAVQINLNSNNEELDRLRKQIEELQALLRTEQSKNTTLESTLTSRYATILKLGVDQKADWARIAKLEADNAQLEDSREEYRARNEALIQEWAAAVKGKELEVTQVAAQRDSYKETAETARIALEKERAKNKALVEGNKQSSEALRTIATSLEGMGVDIAKKEAAYESTITRMRLEHQQEIEGQQKRILALQTALALETAGESRDELQQRLIESQELLFKTLEENAQYVSRLEAAYELLSLTDPHGEQMLKRAATEFDP